MNEIRPRKPYPSDVTDDEWAFLVPYLTLLPLDSKQRVHDLREVLNALRWLVRTGAQWRFLPGDFPPWEIVYQQTQRWMNAGCFETLCHDLREALREAAGRNKQPTAAVIDSRTLRSTPESGARAEYDGAKKTKGSKVHLAVDTLGHLLALIVTAADEQDRDLVDELTEEVEKITDGSVELAYVDQGYTGKKAAAAAEKHGIKLEVVRLPGAKKGFVLLPRRWVVERSFAWAARFRRLSRDFERLDEMLAGFHFVAFGMLMLKSLVAPQAHGP
jgi:transposase